MTPSTFDLGMNRLRNWFILGAAFGVILGFVYRAVPRPTGEK